jgi:hypothetical protein
MKTQVILALLITGFSLNSFGQKTKIDKYLNHLPHNLKTESKEPLRYRLTIDWSNRDIDGMPMNHNVAIGILTQGLENDSTELSDVTLTEIGDSTMNKFELKELDGLKYKIDKDNFTRSDFYKSFPQAQIELIRWFVQDQVGFNAYGLMFMDSLILNTPFFPDFFRNHNTKIDNYVNVNTKNLNITWTGISKMNNKLCAIIHYQAMYNSIDSDNDAMKLNGRSCWWGDIWVALDNRQIEFATMSEDLIFKMQLKANQYEQRINLQRELKFEKIK